MKIKTSLSRRVFCICNYAIIAILCLTFLLPLVNVLAKSLNDGLDASRGNIWFWPRVFTWDNYKTVLGGSTFKQSVVITVLRVLLGLVIGLIVQFAAAYAMAKKSFPGKAILLIFFMIPMYFHAGIVPNYVWFSKIGFLNNFWVYILPGAFSFYNVVIIRTFIQTTIPGSLEESAFIDGATEVIVFYKIILPLCKPILATIALWIMVHHWNDWTTTLYYIRKPKLYTMQYIMMELVKESERLQKLVAEAAMMGEAVEEANTPTTDAIVSAQIMVTILPIVCVYPFLQKYFVKGIMMGSVKG